MAALVAVMIMVSIGTFSWALDQESGDRIPKLSSFVMLATVVVVVATHDLAKGVLVGVLLSALFFARKVERLVHGPTRNSRDAARERAYRVERPDLLRLRRAFRRGFDFKEDARARRHRRHATRISGTSRRSRRSTRWC